MSDDAYLESFSNFLICLRIRDLSDVERHQMLHEVEDALSSVLAKHSIDAVLAREPGRAPPLDADAVSGNQRHILEKIGRAIFTEHPNHLKMREIFELLDIDRDGMISANDLHKGLRTRMRTELSTDQIQSIMQLFDTGVTRGLHYFQVVQLLQAAMQSAIEDEDKIIHTKRPSFLPDERQLLDQIGAYIDSNPHAGLIKELFFHLSKTYAHVVTSGELLHFCYRSGIKTAQYDVFMDRWRISDVDSSNDVVDRVVEHFNPRISKSEIHALSYAQFARLCSETANRNFKSDAESDSPFTCSSAE